jgi:hypothetical protein
MNGTRWLIIPAINATSRDSLVEVMRDKTSTQGPRVAAANSILDRGHGKAPQTFEAQTLTH